MERTLGDVIAGLRKGKMLTQAELAERICRRGCEVTHLYISKWEKGYSSPSVVQFLALCDALEVRDIQWEFAGRHTGLLAGFNDKGRQKAAELLNMLFKIDEYRDDPAGDDEAAPRLLRLYAIGVSAGTGNFLDESDYEMIETPSYVASSADFALRVSGDSMEPLYQDGQIIWVCEQPTLNNGEIGIFYYSDNVYCKKLISSAAGTYLRSINPVYDDIEINDELGFKVIGKVVS